MADHETSQSIDQAAADWVARMDRSPLSSEEAAALEAWMAGDSRRRGAFLRARAVAMLSESARALGPHFDPAGFGPKSDHAQPCVAQSRPTHSHPALSRRQALTWGGVLAASLAVAIVAGVSLQAPEAHATERGEVRRVPLADGSTVTLNTNTKVTVRNSNTRCLVTLIEGEIFLDARSGPDHPLVVQAAGCHLSAHAGAFRVRRIGDAPIDILVGAGRVDLSVSDGAATNAFILNPGTRAVVLPAPRNGVSQVTLQPVAADVIARDTAWLEGEIAFEGDSLAEAAAAFVRYSDTRIVIEDPSLAREPITGLFAANDPVGFSKAVAAAFGAQAEKRDDVIILRRAKAGH